MRVAGLISGTSHDGIDVAVVDFRLEGSALTGHVLHTDGVPYDPALRARLVAALPPAPTTLAEVARLDTEIGQAFAAVAADAAAAVGGVDAASSHGQTVFHWVEGPAALGTLQIGQPAWIAERLGVPVVADVRARDIAAGGQGAPLVALLDRLLLRGRGRAGALNLGGIANLTVVDGDDVTAFDIGPANALVDAVVAARRLHALGFDEDGRLAGAGVVDRELLGALLADPYYVLAPPKTTGKEHFHHAYVQERVAAHGRPVADVDLVATLTALTVRTVADAVRAARLDRLVISGGGCRNPVVVDGLRAALPGVDLVRSDALGAPADAKEAILLALLGWCTLHGVPGVVPGSTGASAARVLGAIVPGSAPLVLPEPVARVDSLRLLPAGSGS